MSVWNIQLVFDAADPDVPMLFWGPKLEYRSEQCSMTPDELREWRKDFPQFDGRGRIDDADGRRMPIYIQQVPEPKAGGNRVRLEIEMPDEEPGEHADPEGNEYAVARGPAPRLRTITFDCISTDRMLEFWSEATGYTESNGRLDHQPGAFRIESGEFYAYDRKIPSQLAAWTLGFTEPSTLPDREVHDLIPGISFRQTGEQKRYKNRLHLDLRSLELNGEAMRERMEKLGARELWRDNNYVVMADPEGNEFCVS
jgi:hypothetical protein